MIAVIDLPNYNLIERDAWYVYIKKLIEDSKNKNKDTQLEINFDKIDKEKEIADKNKTKNKYENLTKSELIKLLTEKDKEIEKEKNRNKFLEERNTKLSDGYNYMERLYNGTREACAKWKNEAMNYQYKLRKYKLFNDLL